MWLVIILIVIGIGVLLLKFFKLLVRSVARGLQPLLPDKREDDVIRSSLRQLVAGWIVAGIPLFLLAWTAPASSPAGERLATSLLGAFLLGSAIGIRSIIVE